MPIPAASTDWSAGISVTRAWTPRLRSGAAAWLTSPWRWPSDPVYDVKHLGSLCGANGSNSLPTGGVRTQACIFNPSLALVLPSQTQMPSPGKFSPKCLLDALRRLCLLLPSALSLPGSRVTESLGSSHDRRPRLASPPIHIQFHPPATLAKLLFQNRNLALSRWTLHHVAFNDFPIAPGQTPKSLRWLTRPRWAWHPQLLPRPLSGL